MRFPLKAFLFKFTIGGAIFASMMAFIDMKDGHETDWIKFIIQFTVMGSLFGFIQPVKK